MLRGGNMLQVKRVGLAGYVHFEMLSFSVYNYCSFIKCI